MNKPTYNKSYCFHGWNKLKGNLKQEIYNFGLYFIVYFKWAELIISDYNEVAKMTLAAEHNKQTYVILSVIIPILCTVLNLKVYKDNQEYFNEKNIQQNLVTAII
ncbi:hypothetical protein C1645_842062 [Glomus cerebriforme]|uniref:Uncharacterized protein n=1 Tax=Glomus cerebriforme TaxID=658196 RepID=A0A397RYZ4_9GLOM|nr:hypothetical protein C1645_842062 [Glomus cerebriforme]